LENKPVLSCVLELTFKSNVTMKGKTLTAIVLILEIASIAVLHAVKFNQSEKTAVKEITKAASAEIMDTRAKPVISLAVLK
jgi:hypothetical protein